MCPSVASTHLEEAIGIIWARFPFLLFLGLFQTMYWAIRYLVGVSLLVETTFVWVFDELINCGIRLELGQIAMLQIVILVCLMTITKRGIIITHPSISFDTDLAG